IACNNDGDNMYQYFRFEIYDVGTTYQSILNELEFYGNTGFIHLTPKVATCTETGIKQECWYSNGKYFSDANGTTELDESAVVEPMIPHSGTHHEASATNTEYWQCSVCGKCFSDEACTNEISEAETLIGVFGAITDGRYTLTSQTYTLTDDVNTAGYIYVPEGVTATIDLNGHTIDRGLTSADNNGSVIIVEGTLTITDSGTDGKIQGGYDGYAEHGFYVSGVEVQNGATFNLQGGTLVGRNQDYDYTVAVDDNGSFTMTGGKITGGWTGVLAVGNVTLTGGEISGNSNSGVRVGENISISGNPVIIGNTVMNADLRSSGGICKINITGALTDGANIGITVHNPTDNSPVTVTSGYNTYNSVSPDTYFSLDNDGQIQTSPIDYMTVVMGWNEDRTEIAVGTASRNVNFDLQGHGSNIEAVSLLNGYKLIEPTEPTAEGWSFGGWYTDAECTDGNAWDFTSGVTSDMTLYALWTQGQTYRVTLPENMVIVSADNEVVGGKYPTGTNIRFKVKSADYVVDGDVKNDDDVLTADGDGIYTVTVGDADITITATVKKAVEANKELSGSESYTAQNGDVLTGSTSGTVTIPDGESITLSDVNITGGIVCNGTATITLVGTNSVSGATNKAGIQIGGSGTTLTIKGNGSLTANGGSQSAGIGLSRAWDVDAMGGDIVIEGGNITATGDNFGAGIGTGVSYGNGTDNTATIGNITIKGGTVKAIGGTNQSYPGSGIGKGGAYSNGHAVVGTITIYDDIDMVDASSISESIVYMHETTDVTASTSDYFTIIENGNRRIIVQKVTPTTAYIPDQTYTGSEIKPEPQVMAGSLSLTKGADYEYSYTNNTNVGTAKVTVTFKGDYASLGSVEKEFNIVRATPTVTAPTANTLTYNGGEQELVTAGSTNFGNVLYSLDGETYSENIPKGKDAGTYTVYYKVDTENYYYAPQTVEVTIAESYTITWKNGDEILETDNYVPGGATPEYNGETPTKDADAQYTYTFSGWSPAVDTVTGNATYTAQFSKATREYAVTWKDGDGNTLKTDQVAYGETPAYTGDTPTKTATAQYTYTFNETWDTAISAVTGDVTYTAQFDSTVNKYTVTWKNGDTVLETDENVPYGTTPTYDGETPTKTADAMYTYSFAGWSPEISDVTGNVTYTAQFSSTAKSYTITYKVDGEIYKTESVSYGNSIALPDAPTREGYTFSGWQTSYTTMPASDIEITGTFAINTYAVNFVDADGVTALADTQAVSWNEKASAPDNPTKDGFVFLYWTADGTTEYDFETAVTDNLTLRAVWKEAVNATVQLDVSSGIVGGKNSLIYVSYAGDLSEGCTVTSVGFYVATNKFLGFTDDNTTNVMDLDGYDVKEIMKNNTTGLVKEYVKAESTHELQLRVGANTSYYFYVLPYVVVTDESGNEYVFYGDVSAATFDSVQ
ncbi:MAG: InlB B-repeat-containing protein, partial [Ruminococcus sp.]|nr:InlB B-repeat-containing protein [Ruminococcus sp.]